MKKWILCLAAVAGVCALAYTATVVYTTLLINGTQAYSRTYPVNLNTVGSAGLSVDRLTVQVNWANQSAASSTFNDGHIATGTLTVSSNAGLVQAASTNTITIASTAQILGQSATDYLTVLSTTGISGAVLTVNGNTLTEGVDWFRTSFASSTAANIAATIGTRINGVQASAGGAVVFTTATVMGVGGNSFTLASSTPTAISVSSAVFTGGADPIFKNAVLVIDGTQYRNGYLWTDADGTSSGTATSVAALVNTLSGLQANAAGSVVYATATVAGTIGNAHTVSQLNTTGFTFGGASFTGGLNNAAVSIGGVALTQGTDWTRQTTASGTAKSISDAIMANATLNQVLVSTWSASGVVFASSTAVGVGQNYTLGSTAASALVPSGAGLSGGTDTAVNITTEILTVPGHGLALAQAVLYSTGTGVTVAPLVTGTTYYAIPLDANTLQLATSTTTAVAGTYINFTSSSTTGPHNFTLAPLATTGTASFKWQASNDCATYSDISVSSITIPSPYTAGSQGWDFGTVAWKCLQLNYIAPTTGGINLQVIPNGKNSQ